MERGIRSIKQGIRTTDGAGVQLVRVLAQEDVYDFDPFLMLDSFDSTNPADYTRGFPTHPHRGIETITYLIHGRIEHEDSLGNRGVIRSGQSQWMTAGGGILHQEMPQASPRMLGIQLWLNMPQAQKMSPPAYNDITEAQIPAVDVDGSTVRVLSGRFGAAQGFLPRHVPATILDIALPAGKSLQLDTIPGQTAFLFTILGAITTAGQAIAEKSAVLYDDAEHIAIQANGGDARVLFFMAPPLREPIAWGGPIVMNTREELDLAFRQLRRGTFLQS